MAREIVYEVEITGNGAPYKYKLYRMGGSMKGRTWVAGEDGVADSITEAAFEAKAAAMADHEEWLHSTETRTMEVLRLEDPRDKASDEDEPAAVEPEQKPRNPAPELNPMDFMD